MEMCILPECQMTGNPNTADMCEGCFKAHMDMEKEYGRGTRHQEDDGFVMVNNQREEDRIPRRVDSSERVQSDIINRREALLNKLGMEFQEPLRKCEIRKCDQLAAPPEFKYCLECLEDVEPQSSASSLPMGTPPEAVGRSAPELPHRPQNYGPQRQLRGVFVSSPIYSTSVQKYRSKCQRPGGCPDGMFGDSAKKNLCSKCWKAVGEVMPATQRAPGAHQGNYGDMAHGPATPPRHTGRKDHDMMYSGRADSGYQHSQEALRYTEGGYQAERGFREPEAWKEGTYQTGRGGSQREGYPSGGGRTRDVYQSGGGRLRDENQIGPADNHLYEELDQLCAQPGCRRPAAENVEKFCDQCHENYKAIFLGYRQINESGPPGQ